VGKKRHGRKDVRLKPEATSSKHLGLKPEATGKNGSFRLQPEGLCVLLIVLAGIWAYSNSLNGVFVLDDVRAIVQNVTIRSLTPLGESLAPPPRSTVSGRPFANLSFAVNYAISGLNVRSYHILNVGIHLACALALFGVVRRTLLSDRLRDRFSDSATYVAASAALIWVVHPLTTSAVTYIVQRVESLMSLFYLLTLYCAIRAGAQRAWQLAAVLFCTVGMATKEVMVTAPVAVLVWDVIFRPGRRIRWGFLCGLAATWIVFAVLVSREFRTPSISLSVATAWQYLLTQAEVLTQYLRLSLVPSPLVFLYTWPLVTSVRGVIGEAMFMSALLGLTVVGLSQRHPLTFAGALFFLILAPTSSVIPIVTEVAAEHRMYLPLAAVLATLVVGVFLASHRFLGLRGAVATIFVVTLAAVLTYGSLTRARNRDYASEQQLWADTVNKDPQNQRARVAYGSVLAQGGRVSEAEQQFRRAVELNPRDALARSRLASTLAAQGRFDDAVTQLREALTLDDSDIDGHRMLGQILAMRREDAEAIVHLERALLAQTDNPQLLVQVASLRADSRDLSVQDLERATKLAERAVELTSRREATALDVLGLAYARQRRFVEAASAAQDALAIARATGNAAAVKSIETRLSAYKAQIK
jgi:tetratricopeptide (TPR) repeat protein